MTPAPKRHWFRFSLRALVVALTIVAVLLAWVGASLHRARQRTVLASFLARGAAVGKLVEDPPQLPIVWRLTGHLAMPFEIELPRDLFTESDRQMLQACFPETNVVLVDRAPDLIPTQ